MSRGARSTPSRRARGHELAGFLRKAALGAKVAAVPGDAFGELGDGFFRCSYAASVQNIQKAVDRIAAFVAGAGSAG